MLRKALSTACCVSLLLVEPGVPALFAQTAQILGPDPHAVEMDFGDKRISVPQVVAQPDEAASVGDLKAKIQGLNIPPEARDRAMRVVRLLGDHPPPEVQKAIGAFVQNLNDQKADPQVLLAQFMDGVGSYASFVFQSSNVSDVTVDDGNTRVVQVYNTILGQEVEKKVYTKISETSQRVEVFQPDPSNPGAKRLERIVFVQHENGVMKEKTVWDRRVLEDAEDIKFRWLENAGLVDKLSDPVYKNRREAIQAQIDQRSGDYCSALYDEKHRVAWDASSKKCAEPSKIDEIIAQLGESNIGRLRDAHLTPAEIEQRSKQLSTWQLELQLAQDVKELEEVQKELLSDLLQYYLDVLGTGAAGLNAKQLAQLSIDDIQKRLYDFENGVYDDYGLFGELLAKVAGIRLDSGAIKIEANMPAGMRRASSFAIQFLGLAVDAKNRMLEAKKAGQDKVRDAARDTMIKYTQAAYEHLRVFEAGMSTVELEALRDNKSINEFHLRKSAIDEADKLIGSVRALDPRYEELDQRTFQTMIRQAASTFALTITNARYMDLDVGDFKDPLGVLAAKAKEMKDLALFLGYSKWLKDSKNVEEYRRQSSSKTYYADQAKGGMFEYYKNHLDADTSAAIAMFDDIGKKIDSLGSGASASQIQTGLDQVSAKLSEVMRALGLKDIPDPSEASKEVRHLAVYRSWLSQATDQASQNLQVFTQIYENYLSLKKNGTSENLEETRSKSSFNRLSDWVGAKFNTLTLGGRDGARNALAAYMSPETYKMLIEKDSQGKLRVDRILDMLDGGDFNGALDSWIALDPRAARMGELRGWIGNDVAAAREYLGLKDTHTDLPDYRIDAIIKGAVERCKQKSNANADTAVTPGGCDKMSARFSAVSDSFAKNLDDYIFWGEVATIPLDIVVSSIALIPLGPVLSLGFRLVGEAAVGLADLLTPTIKPTMGLFSRALSMAPQIVTKPVGWAGNVLIKQANSINDSFGLAALSKWGSAPLLTSYQMGREAMLYTVRSEVGLTTFSTGMTAIKYEADEYMNPGGHSRSLVQTVGRSALDNAAWGAPNAWMFAALSVPSSAISGTNVAARAYRAFGNSAGPLNASITGMLRLASRMSEKLLSREVGTAIIRNEQGVWGWAGERINGIGLGGNSFFAVPLRATLNGGLKAATFADNMGKFMLFTEGVQVVSQQGLYWWNLANPLQYVGLSSPAKPQGQFDPSAKVQAWASAHESVRAINNISFLLIPQGRSQSPKQVTEQRDMQRAIQYMTDRAPVELRNRFMSEPVSGGKPFDVLLGLSDAPLQRIGRALTGRGAKPVELPIETSIKDTLALNQLRRDGFSISELLGILRISKADAVDEKGDPIPVLDDDGKPVIKDGKPVYVTTHTQKFWTREQLREWAEGKIPTAASQADLIKRKDVIFDTTSYETAAETLLTEMLRSNYKLARRILEAKDTDTVSLGNDEISISGKKTIEEVRKRVEQLLLNDKSDKLRRDVLREFRQEERKAGGTIQPDDLRKIFGYTDPAKGKIDGLWDRLEKKYGGNLSIAMERNRDLLMTEFLLEYNMDYLNRKIGKVKPAEIPAIAKEIVDRVNTILSFEGIKNPRTNQPITSLRSAKPGEKPKQQEALAAFVETVLGKKDAAIEFALHSFADAVHDKNVDAEAAARESVLKAADPKDEAAFEGLLRQIADAARAGDLVKERATMDAVLAAFNESAPPMDSGAPLSIFTLLEASGGKTLLMKTSFIPFETVRSMNYSSTVRGKIWNWLTQDKRELWVLTENPHLVRQFVEDWPAYSGGLKPNFQVKSMGDLISDELERKQTGDAPGRRNIIVDEGDAPQIAMFRGSPNGDLRYGSPLLEVMLGNTDRKTGFRWFYEEARGTQRTVEGLTARLQEAKKTGADPATIAKLEAEHDQAAEKLEQIKARLDAAIPDQVDRMYDQWRVLMRKPIFGLFGTRPMDAYIDKLAADLVASGKLSRIRAETWAAKMKKDTLKADRVVHQQFGRLYVKPDEANKNKNYIQLVAEKIKKLMKEKGTVGGVWAWLMDDGVKSYLRTQMEQQVKVLTHEDTSKIFQLNVDQRKVIPLNDEAVATPGLDIEELGAAQLLLMHELELRGKQWGDDASRDAIRLTLPLDNDGQIDHAETFERVREGGGDILGTSGTASPDLQENMAKRIKMSFANLAGKSELPSGLRWAVVDDKGTSVTFSEPSSRAKPDGGTTKIDLKTPFEVTPPEGTDYKRKEIIRAALNIVEAKRGEVGVQNAEIAERTLDLMRAKKYVEARAEFTKWTGDAAVKARFLDHLARGRYDAAERMMAPKTGKEEIEHGYLLVMLGPKSNSQVKVFEKAFKDAFTDIDDKSIVRFYPDYVHEMNEGYRKQEVLKQNNAQALDTGEARLVLNVPKIGGRGTDMVFKKYKNVLVIDIEPEAGGITAMEQFLARAGDGRAGHAHREFIGLTSERSLEDNDGLREKLAKTIADARKDAPTEAATRKIKTFLETAQDGKVLTNLAAAYVDATKAAEAADKDTKVPQAVRDARRKSAEDARKAFVESQEFKDFEARADVYRTMVRDLMIDRQRDSNSQAGFQNASEAKGLTKRKVQMLSAAVMMGTGFTAGPLVAPFLGVTGFFGSLVSMVPGVAAGEIVRALANLRLPKDQRASSQFAPMLKPFEPLVGKVKGLIHLGRTRPLPAASAAH